MLLGDTPSIAGDGGAAGVSGAGKAAVVLAASGDASREEGGGVLGHRTTATAAIANRSNAATPAHSHTLRTGMSAVPTVTDADESVAWKVDASDPGLGTGSICSAAPCAVGESTNVAVPDTSSAPQTRRSSRAASRIDP